MNRIDSMGDFIYVKDDVMDKDFCSHLISKFESDVENQYRGVTAGGLKEHVKIQQILELVVLNTGMMKIKKF